MGELTKAEQKKVEKGHGFLDLLIKMVDIMNGIYKAIVNDTNQPVILDSHTTKTRVYKCRVDSDGKLTPLYWDKKTLEDNAEPVFQKVIKDDDTTEDQTVH